MLTGIREAVRALHLLRNDSQEAAAEAANMVSAEAHKPRKGVRAAKAKSPLDLHHGPLRRPCKTVFNWLGRCLLLCTEVIQNVPQPCKQVWHVPAHCVAVSCCCALPCTYRWAVMTEWPGHQQHHACMGCAIRGRHLGCGAYSCKGTYWPLGCEWRLDDQVHTSSLPTSAA